MNSARNQSLRKRIAYALRHVVLTDEERQRIIDSTWIAQSVIESIVPGCFALTLEIDTQDREAGYMSLGSSSLGLHPDH